MEELRRGVPGRRGRGERHEGQEKDYQRDEAEDTSRNLQARLHERSVVQQHVGIPLGQVTTSFARRLTKMRPFAVKARR